MKLDNKTKNNFFFYNFKGITRKGYVSMTKFNTNYFLIVMNKIEGGKKTKF